MPLFQLPSLHVFNKPNFTPCFPASNPGRGEIFRTRPDQPWDPPSLLYNGYRVFPGVKSGRGVALTTHLSSTEVKEIVELYLYSPSWPSWPVIGWPLPLPYFKFTSNFIFKNMEIWEGKRELLGKNPNVGMNTVDTYLKWENIEPARHLLQGFVLMTVSTAHVDTPLLIHRHANTRVTTHDYTVFRLPKLNT